MIRRDLRFYIIAISLCIIAIFVINIFTAMPALGIPLWLNAVGVVGSAIAVIAIDGFLAGMAHKMVNKINVFTRYFNVSKREKQVYVKFGVRKFKDYLPDLGTLVKFPKGKIVEPNSPEYIHTYIRESCVGEIGHIAGAVCGFLIILIFPPWIFPYQYMFCFGIPVAIVNIVFSTMPVMALRYNRFALFLLYKKVSRRKVQEPTAITVYDTIKKDPVVTEPSDIEIVVTEQDGQGRETEK